MNVKHNPFKIAAHFYGYRRLIIEFSRREIVRRYRGSLLGMLWTLIQPLIMLGVYTFVFSVVFETKWGKDLAQGRLTFAMALFAGILTFNIIGDTLNASPGIILGNANFVKKVVFPLEILPVVKLIESVFYSFFGLIVLLGVLLISGHPPGWTSLLIPLVWLPVMFFTLGISFFLSSLGVFVRDVGAVVGILVTMFLFLSPIFYPLAAVPESLLPYYSLNPIAVFVENTRRVLLWGQLPDWPWFFAYFFFSMIVFLGGYHWFMKTKHAFADVI